jgi:hypothetical protein
MRSPRRLGEAWDFCKSRCRWHLPHPVDFFTLRSGNPNDASTFTVTLKAPLDAPGTLHLMSGRQVLVPPDGLVAMTAEDSKPLSAIDWVETKGAVDG